MNKQQLNKYKVTFVGENEELSIEVESPFIVDCDHEENVHDIIDLATEIGYLQFGEDFKERIEVYLIGLDYAK